MIDANIKCMPYCSNNYSTIDV